MLPAAVVPRNPRTVAAIMKTLGVPCSALLRDLQRVNRRLAILIWIRLVTRYLSRFFAEDVLFKEERPQGALFALEVVSVPRVLIDAVLSVQSGDVTSLAAPEETPARGIAMRLSRP